MLSVGLQDVVTEMRSAIDEVYTTTIEAQATAAEALDLNHHRSSGPTHALAMAALRTMQVLFGWDGEMDKARWQERGRTLVSKA